MVDVSTLMITCLETQMNAKVHHYGEKCNVNIFHQTLLNVNVYIPCNLVQIHGTTARCEWGNDGELPPPRRHCAGMQPRRDGCGRWQISGELCPMRKRQRVGCVKTAPWLLFNSATKFDTKQQPTTCSSWNTYQCNIIWQFLKINVFMHAPPHQMPKHLAPFQSQSLFSNLHPLAVAFTHLHVQCISSRLFYSADVQRHLITGIRF